MGARDARGLDAATRRLIRFKAWELAQNSAFTADDQEDIEQELTLDLLQRSTKYDAERGTWKAFARRVVEHKVATLLEHQLAERRDPHRVAFSLNESIRESSGERGAVLSPDSLDLPWLLPVDEDHEFQIDLARAIYGLPPALASLAEDLTTQNVTEISRERGIPRGTLYDAIKRIEAAFEAAGLRAYLGGVRRFRRPSGT